MSSKPTPVTQQSLVDAAKKIDLSKLAQRAVGSYDLSQIPADKLEIVAHICLHCALNGPVGTSKDTTFPGLDYKGSIKGVLAGVTNAQWRAIVLVVAESLELSREEVRNSYCVKNFGSVWPLCDKVFTAKKRT